MGAWQHGAHRVRRVLAVRAERDLEALVAGYIAVVGVLPLPGEGPVCQSDFTARWVAFSVFVVLCPLALQMLYVVKRRSLSGIGPRVPLFEHGAALTAFVAWALVLPLTPAATWCGWQFQYGAAIGVVVLLLLGLVTQVARLPVNHSEA